MRSLKTVSIVVPLMALSMGIAHADANDDHFLLGVNNIGIVGSPADLINNARIVCNLLDQGNSPKAISDAIISSLGFRPDRAVTFAALSVTHYCPQYGNMRFDQ
jgi:hypothetical protein